jgi:hypothetical protein
VDTLSLHDALPIFEARLQRGGRGRRVLRKGLFSTGIRIPNEREDRGDGGQDKPPAVTHKDLLLLW